MLASFTVLYFRIHFFMSESYITGVSGVCNLLLCSLLFLCYSDLKLLSLLVVDSLQFVYSEINEEIFSLLNYTHF